SVNTICTAGDISKGILYHYFRDKDELYLACVQELFDRLTEYLTDALGDVSGTETAQLERYFDANWGFFTNIPSSTGCFATW
ncbi:MAG: TetR/AcrR family transcriptional regulator, partial [Clostridia bacterium]